MNTILDRMNNMKLFGMRKQYEEQKKTPEQFQKLSFEDRLDFLLEHEQIFRENKALKSRISNAKFKVQSSISDIQASAKRGLDNHDLKNISSCKWIEKKQNILLIGASGVGKTWIATALAHKACLYGVSAKYFRLQHLLSEIESARAEGTLRRLITRLGKLKVMIIDDFCLSAVTEFEEKNLFEIIDERHGKGSTIITSQNPQNIWHGLFPNPAIADAILDRLVHGSLKIELKGESWRKKTANAIDES